MPEEGLEVRFSQEGEKLLRLLPEKNRMDFSLRRAEITCFAKMVRHTVSLRTKLETAVEMECSRCLEPVTYPFLLEFDYTLVPEESGIGEEDLSAADENLNCGTYKDEVVDLGPLVLEQIVLQIPVKPLCNESCKGLCPHCGINLNKAACDCGKETADHRFAALKDFKVAKKA